jgi:hypothetical protein
MVSIALLSQSHLLLISLLSKLYSTWQRKSLKDQEQWIQTWVSYLQKNYRWMPARGLKDSNYNLFYKQTISRLRRRYSLHSRAKLDALFFVNFTFLLVKWSLLLQLDDPSSQTTFPYTPCPLNADGLHYKNKRDYNCNAQVSHWLRLEMSLH